MEEGGLVEVVRRGALGGGRCWGGSGRGTHEESACADGLLQVLHPRVLLVLRDTAEVVEFDAVALLAGDGLEQREGVLHLDAIVDGYQLGPLQRKLVDELVFAFAFIEPLLGLHQDIVEQEVVVPFLLPLHDVRQNAFSNIHLVRQILCVGGRGR